MCFYRSGARQRLRASFFFCPLLLYHIFRRLSTSATDFSEIFLRHQVSFRRPPRVGPASARTRAPKRRTAAPKDGEGPAGRKERWEGRGPAGPDTRAANKPARPLANRVGGGRRLPRGGGRGEQTPTKPGPAHTDVADVSIVSRARARRTKASHETRAQTGTNGKMRDAAGPGTIGNRAAPANPPRGGPAWEVGPQTERRLRSADAREPELHNTRPWGGGPLLSGRGPTDPPLSRSRQRHPRARHQLTGGAGPPLVQASPLSDLRKNCRNLTIFGKNRSVFGNFLQTIYHFFTFRSWCLAFLNRLRAQGRRLKMAR